VRPASVRRSVNPIVIEFFVLEWHFVDSSSMQLRGGVRNFGGSPKKIKSGRGSCGSSAASDRLNLTHRRNRRRWTPHDSYWQSLSRKKI